MSSQDLTMPDNDPQRIRKNKSFVRREGRLTMGQKRALQQQWSRYGLQRQDGRLSITEVFGRHADSILEIGFGMGEALLAAAQQHPDKNFIGIEVYRPGVGSLLAKISQLSMSNIRIYTEDAVEVLSDCIVDNTFSEIRIFFPDPWHKKRHHKRRLIQAPFIELLQQKLRPQGQLHLATDWQNYAEQMMAVLTENSHWYNSCGMGQYSPRPQTRSLTKFEQRGLRLGHQVWDLIFVKK